MKRDVGAELDVQIDAPTTLEFQIAVAPQPGAEVTESLSFVLNGKKIPLDDIQEISGEHGNRIHKFDAPVGTLRVEYSATVIGEARAGAVSRHRPVDLSAAQSLRRGRQVLRFRRHRVRRPGRIVVDSGEGVVLGGRPTELRPRFE